MANNLIVGDNIVFGKVDVPILDIGLTTSNTTVVYGFNPLRSHKPERQINSLNIISEGEGYLLKAKQIMDKSDFFTPPFPDSSVGNVVIQW